MSRFDKKKISFNSDLEIKQVANLVTAKGPKGENAFKIPEGIAMNMSGGEISFSYREGHPVKEKAKLGLAFRMIQNLIQGVNEGFSKKLEINGVGYRWNISGKKLNMQLGFSHEVVYDIPEGVSLAIEGNTLTIQGVDKGLVGLVAAKIKNFRPVEPYKGKGIKYVGEFVVRKVGKAGN